MGPANAVVCSFQSGLKVSWFAQSFDGVCRLITSLVHTFPFFPAEIVDLIDDRDEVPDAVLNEETASRAAAKNVNKDVWLVRFFDARSSYGWITGDRLDELGEDENVDAMYLAGKDREGKSKGFKTPSLKKACRKGYR